MTTPLTLCASTVTGVQNNNHYPNQHSVTDAASLSAVVGLDHVAATYVDDRQSSAAFVASDCVVMDVDNDHTETQTDWVTPEKLGELMAGVEIMTATFRNHMKPKGVLSARPRFHVYFPIHEIRKADDYAGLKHRLAARFVFFDRNALDAGRSIYGTSNAVVTVHEGDQLLDAWLDNADEQDVSAAFDQSTLVIGEGSRNATLSRFVGRVLIRYGETDQARNLTIAVEDDSHKELTSLMTDLLPDLHTMGTTQTFPLYTREHLSPTSSSEPDLFADLATASESPSDGAATASSLDFSRPISDQIPVILDGYHRVDNITDATLASYREHYGDTGITKEDIFFYVYALLHHPEYRERYEDDLKKMLPHIPRAAGFHTYASVGRELAELHVNYERVEPYPSVQEEASLHAPKDPWERYRIGERKMRFPKLGHRDEDFTRLEYNDYVTLTGIPAEAQGYSISGRSPLGWIIDRYHVKMDKASGIVNDPNDFLREQGRPDAVVDLIKRLVTVSMRTQELLATLPALEIPEVQS